MKKFVLLSGFILSGSIFGQGIKLRALTSFTLPPPMQQQALQVIKVYLPRNKILFIPNYEKVGEVTSTIHSLAGEVSMYSATPEFALANGGPLTAEIIKQIPAWYYAAARELGLYPNIDIRVHTLDIKEIPAGFLLFPAIPGWHADSEFRETYFSQPDLNKVPVSLHAIATISTHPDGVSNIQFLDDALEMMVDEDLPDSPLWVNVHRFISNMEEFKTADMKDGTIFMFDARSLHRSTAVKVDGQRMFFRMSMWHKPNLGDGQISKQEQLYLLPKHDFAGSTARPMPEAFFPPTSLGRFARHVKISDLAAEQSIFGASISEIQQNGGSISKELVRKIPAFFSQEGFKPVVDMLIFRLYPGYRPFFPNYAGRPQSVDWHTSSDVPRPEIWMSVSSHKGGVNETQFRGRTLGDGEILLAYASTPRRELPTKNRGWRLLMRVRSSSCKRHDPLQKNNPAICVPRR